MIVFNLCGGFLWNNINLTCLSCVNTPTEKEVLVLLSSEIVNK